MTKAPLPTDYRVKKVVVEELGASPASVTDDAKFGDDLGADSLDRTNVVMALEEEFGVHITDDAMEAIVTVGDAVKAVEAATKWKEAAL